MPQHYALAIAALATLASSSAAAALSVGVGRANITPQESIWMAGYAARTAPSDGALNDLWAKALVIEDDAGERSVVVTLDILGISAPVAKVTSDRVMEEFGIPRERLMLTSSHTHSGPVVRDNLIGMYNLSEDQIARVTKYTNALPEHIVKAIGDAIEDLEPGSLQRGNGHVDFAGNRRKYTETSAPINNSNPIGPVDHDVPVVVAKRANGEVKGILFGYACHNTTLGLQQLSGDYSGFAQDRIEEEFPGVVAMYAAGCGGDQNPLPRRTIPLARLYGEMLGDAVADVVLDEMLPLAGPVSAKFETIPLKLSPAPSREEIEKQRESDNKYVQRRADHLLGIIDEKGALPETYPYPVQVWQFGDGFQMTALGGEVTVDYALRIKAELGAHRQFVIAYANDVMSYIPSLRVLREGGYEGETSMIYYGFHGPWAPSIEEDIMASVHHLSGTMPTVVLSDAKSLAERKPLVIAHRGGVVDEDSPECSETAIRRAALAGYDMVELDIRMSKDGQPIVFHDRALRPASDQDGSIESHTAREIRAFTFAKNGEPIMHLDTALALCKEERLGVMLDIKAEGNPDFFRRIIGLLERHELKPNAMCINGAAGVREHLGGHIFLRATDEDIADPNKDLSQSFWFGIARNLTAEMAAEVKARGALVIPAINTFRYDENTHMEDTKQDVDRLLKAEIDGFQIDSIYQHYFGLK